MYLVGFELDLPYEADNEKIKTIMEKESCQYYDATERDYEMNWKEKRLSFRKETRCITAMYERLFEKLKIDDCRKIIVDCVENITGESISNALGVTAVQVKFNYFDFYKKNDQEKKIETLNLLMEGIEKIAKCKYWPIDQFRNVALLIKEADYLNEWTWKKVKRSPNKKYYAEVLCQHNVKNMDISIIIRGANGVEMINNKVISEVPEEFAYARHLGELKWLSNEEAALINKDGTAMVTVCLK